MSEYENMSSSEELMAFLDGELNPEQANTLFYEIAKDPDLQQEMHELLKMKNTYRNARLVPPEHLKSNIMIATGLSKGTWFSDKLMPIGSFLISGYRGFALLTGVVLTTIMLLMGGADKSVTKFSELPLISASSQYAISSEADLTESELSSYTASSNISVEKSNSVAYSSTITRHDVANRALSSNSNAAALWQVQFSDAIENTGTKMSSEIYSSPFEMNNLSFGFNARTPGKGFWPESDYFLGGLLDNVSLRLSAGNAIAGNDYNLSNEKPILSDFSFAMMYQVSENVSFGLELGRSNFNHEYEALYDGEYYMVKQDADYNWMGVSGQYTMDPISEAMGLQPYARAMLGVSNIGPILSGSVGLEYGIMGGLKVYTGLNAASIMYNQDKTSYLTSKLNYSLGIVIGL